MVTTVGPSNEEFAVLIATLLGGLAALIAVVASLRVHYRRTLGRRRDRYERLARLGTGAQLSFFESVLGEPPAVRTTIRQNSVSMVGPGEPGFDPSLTEEDQMDALHDFWSPREFVECFFIDRDYYVQTISDHEDTVLAFSVTVRRRRFRPSLCIPRRIPLGERVRVWLTNRIWIRPLAKVQLGRTRFASLDARDPDEWAPPHFRAGIGARWVSYSEFRYYGNPGHYQTYVFSAGTNAPGRGELHLVGEVLRQAGFSEWPYPDRWDPEEIEQPPPQEEEPSWEDISAAARLRQRTVITSYTVIGPGLWEVNFPSRFGPHGDEVRTLP